MKVSDLLSQIYQILSHVRVNRTTHSLASGTIPIFTCEQPPLSLRRIAIHAPLPCTAGGRCVGVSRAGRGQATTIPRCSLSGAGGCVWIIQSPWDSASGLTRGLADWLTVSACLRPRYPPRIPGGSGPCGDLCLPREPVQVGLHLRSRSIPRPRPPGKREETPAEPFLALPLPSPPREVG